MTDLLVLHDLGASGGAEWGAAFAAWPGRVIAPDLPGHNGAPAPVGGQYDSGDAVYLTLDLLRAEPVTELIVVGVGHSGAAAQVLALGGRAVGLVLVDGLGGPWETPEEIDRRQRELRRQILETPTALAVPPTGGDDPRATMVVGRHDRTFAARQAAGMPVPTLVVETPASPTPDADDLGAGFPHASLVRLSDRHPATIADAVTSWWPPT